MGMLHDLRRLVFRVFHFSFFLSFCSKPDGRFRRSLHSRFTVGFYLYRFLYDTNDWDVDDSGSAELLLDKRLK